MTSETLAALVTFAAVASITPGPNNVMLLASGVNFGFRRTVPHMLGIGVGFTVMVAVVGLGLTPVFDAAPVLHRALRLLSLAYMLWLAWQLSRAGPVGDDLPGTGRPMRFLGAAAFQWVNPKAWVMALTATAAYAGPGGGLASVLPVALVFGAVNLPAVSLWAGCGAAMQRFLSNPVTLRRFNVVMALLLVLSLWPVLAEV